MLARIRHRCRRYMATETQPSSATSPKLSHPATHITSSVSTFAVARERNFVLVDKTMELKMIIANDSKYVFCRPSKFGKTMTLTTLGSLFSGERHFFDGSVGSRLAIADTDWDWKSEQHNVLHFNMQGIARRKDFRHSLMESIRRLGQQHGLGDSVSRTSVKGAVRDLIVGAASRSPSGKVVVLVDEVDAPVSDVLSSMGPNEKQIAADANSLVVSDFLDAIEALEGHIRFQFYTAVGRIDIPGYISDLTFDDHAANLVGYTTEEIRQNFGRELAILRDKLDAASTDEVEEKISDWYGGYNWGSLGQDRHCHNPYAINMLMRCHEFGPHWSSAVGPMLWLFDVLMQTDVANPFEGQLPLQMELPWKNKFKRCSDAVENDIHMLLLKLGLLTVRRVEVDAETLVRIGRVGVPNM